LPYQLRNIKQQRSGKRKENQGIEPKNRCVFCRIRWKFSGSIIGHISIQSGRLHEWNNYRAQEKWSRNIDLDSL